MKMQPSWPIEDVRAYEDGFRTGQEYTAYCRTTCPEGRLSGVQMMIEDLRDYLDANPDTRPTINDLRAANLPQGAWDDIEGDCPDWLCGYADALGIEDDTQAFNF